MQLFPNDLGEDLFMFILWYNIFVFLMNGCLCCVRFIYLYSVYFGYFVVVSPRFVFLFSQYYLRD